MHQRPPAHHDPARLRIALYSHDTQGLGHIRRNLLIARALGEPVRNPVVLLLSGIHETAATGAFAKRPRA